MRHVNIHTISHTIRHIGCEEGSSAEVVAQLVRRAWKSPSWRAKDMS